MRRAEIVTASLMAVFSVYLMWKSAELPIGWIPDEGPGGGAFSFWLSAVMLSAAFGRWLTGIADQLRPPNQRIRSWMPTH